MKKLMNKKILILAVSGFISSVSLSIASTVTASLLTTVASIAMTSDAHADSTTQNIKQLEVVNAPSTYSKKQLSNSLFSLRGTIYFKTNNFETIVQSLVKKDGKWFCNATKKQIKAIKNNSKGKIKIRNGKLEFAELMEMEMGSDEYNSAGGIILPDE